MSDCKIYPADTVDIYGNVWPTVGENIRNGMFGENVKVGRVHIDKGTITSTDFTITDRTPNSFRIKNITIILLFPETVINGGINAAIANSYNSSTIRNTQDFTNVSATLKIIYKDL